MDSHPKKSFQDRTPISGRFGRLDEETFAYYRKLSDDDHLQNDEDSDAKATFLDNAFNQLISEAVKVSQNQTVSRIIEGLLYAAKPKHILALLEVFVRDLETVCTDRFSSYVMQTAVLLSSQHFNDEESGEKLSEIFEIVYRFFNSQLPLFMQDTYASHIVRVMIEILGGVHVDQRIVRSRVAQAKNKEEKAKQEVALPKPSKQHLQWLEDLGHKIVGLAKLKDHAKNYLSNPVLQTLLLVLHQRDDYGTLDSMLRALVINMDMFEKDVLKDLPELACHTVGSRLVEQVLVLATSDLQEHLYKQYIQGNVIKWVIDPSANYAMQRLLEKGSSTDLFERLFDELVEHLEDILAVQHMGVMVALADGIIKHNTRHKPFIMGLQKAFHCYEPEERRIKLVTLVASLTTYDVFYKLPDEKEKEGSDSDDDDDDSSDSTPFELPSLQAVEYHGSLLLQRLLRMSGVQSVVAGGLLTLKPAELMMLATDRCGNHILEALVKSDAVPPRLKEQLAKKLKKQYVTLACDRTGSRVLDSVWEWSPLKVRTEVAQELLLADSRLRHHSFGKYVHRKCQLDMLQKNKKEWQDKQVQDINKRKLAQELLAQGDTDRPKKKMKLDLPAEDAAEEKQDSTVKVNDENVATKSKKKDKRKEKTKGDTKSTLTETVLESDDESRDKKKEKKQKKKDKILKTESVQVSIEGTVRDKKRKQKLDTSESEAVTDIQHKSKKRKKNKA